MFKITLISIIFLFPHCKKNTKKNTQIKEKKTYTGEIVLKDKNNKFYYDFEVIHKDHLQDKEFIKIETCLLTNKKKCSTYDLYGKKHALCLTKEGNYSLNMSLCKEQESCKLIKKGIKLTLKKSTSQILVSLKEKECQKRSKLENFSKKVYSKILKIPFAGQAAHELSNNTQNIMTELNATIPQKKAELPTQPKALDSATKIDAKPDLPIDSPKQTTNVQKQDPNLSSQDNHSQNEDYSQFYLHIGKSFKTDKLSESLQDVIFHMIGMRDFIVQWAINQKLNIKDQLKLGVRAFDIRLTNYFWNKAEIIGFKHGDVHFYYK